MASRDNYGIHLFAGGMGGTVGAVLTCPLEVVKTRLQSSCAHFQPVYIQTVTAPNVGLVASANLNYNSCHSLQNKVHTTSLHLAQSRSVGLYYCLKYIIQNEGPTGLFKGLGPNLVGVAPSRAIYFFCYANTKRLLNARWNPDTPLVHICSAITAGVTACTATNPIWLIKTRLQLDQKKNNALTVRGCVQDVYQRHGLKGFYKGITASYVGVTETVIHFVIYEALKAHLLENSLSSSQFGDRSTSDFVRFMFAGACSKTCATCIAYPHEVVRTRLRQEGNKYRSFFQTLILVAKEEGHRGLYRGLVTQLVRQIPNTATMMATYELVVYMYERWQLKNT